MPTTSKSPEANATRRERITPLFAEFFRYPTRREFTHMAKGLNEAEARYRESEREAEEREAQIKPRLISVEESLRWAQLIGGKFS